MNGRAVRLDVFAANALDCVRRLKIIQHGSVTWVLVIAGVDFGFNQHSALAGWAFNRSHFYPNSVHLPDGCTALNSYPDPKHSSPELLVMPVLADLYDQPDSAAKRSDRTDAYT